LNPGSYRFIIHNVYGHATKDKYIFSVDNIILKTGDGLQDMEEFSFLVLLSSHPSISNSPTHSVPPSLLPSISNKPSMSNYPSISSSPTSCFGGVVTVNLRSDDEPHETASSIVRIIDGTEHLIFRKRYPHFGNNFDYVHKVCINPGSYKFTMFKYTGNGMKGEAGFTFLVNDEVVFEGGREYGKWSSKEFYFEI